MQEFGGVGLKSGLVMLYDAPLDAFKWPAIDRGAVGQPGKGHLLSTGGLKQV